MLSRGFAPAVHHIRACADVGRVAAGLDVEELRDVARRRSDLGRPDSRCDAHLVQRVHDVLGGEIADRRPPGMAGAELTGTYLQRVGNLATDQPDPH